MPKNFKILRDKLPVDVRARVEKRVAEAIKTMPLTQLRKARAQTQIHVAHKMKTGQASISKLEGRSDIYLSTLRDYIEALGGKLELRAKFPDSQINIDL
jgi:hypothetical protein